MSLNRLCAALLVAGAAQAAVAPLSLVSAGRSSYSIVISQQASPSEHHAAEELQRFLAEMSGARLPIVDDQSTPSAKMILVGDSRAVHRLGVHVPYDGLGAEGFALKTHGPHIVIAGGRLRGTLYGVYAFLEKLGCRWFAPDVSRIPKRPSIQVAPLDETQKPAFEYREPYFTEAFDPDWAARNRNNGSFVKLDAAHGGNVRYHPFVHSFYEMLPPEKHFKQHPEYYSLIDRERRWEGGQLCLTNPDVLRLGVEAVERWIAEEPGATIYSVSQNDWEGWCECDRCRRVEREEGGAHSGPILRYVNAVAEQVEKRHPGKLIDTLAYWYSEDPPAHERPRGNVRIRLCPIGVCEAHPYEKCPRSAYFLKNLKAWAQITGQLYIWHYNTNFSHYLIPFPDFDELAANIPLYKRQGVVGLFMEGGYAKGGGAENSELRSYVMSRLLWNPRADVNQAVNEFLEGYYGAASKPMRAYFDLLHRQGLHIWINPVPDFSDEFLRTARERFGEADAAAANDTERARVRKARLAVDYLGLLRDKTYLVHDGQYAPADLATLRERFTAFLGRVRGFGITSLHEGRDLDYDEKDLATLRKYPVVTLENAALRVEVAPEMAGRVIRMLDKRSGREMLRRTDSGESGYPNVGGLTLVAYPNYHSGALPVDWKLKESNADRFILAGAASQGLTLERIVSLRTDGLHTETTARNAGGTPLDVALLERAEWNPGEIDDAAVRFRTATGTDFRRTLIEPEKPPTGSETFIGATLPDGSWRLSTGKTAPTSTAPTWLSRFNLDLVERAFLTWSAKGSSRAVFGMWSKKRTLAPGEGVRLDVVYAAE